MQNQNQGVLKYCPKCGYDTFSPDCPKSFICGRCNFKLYVNTACGTIGLIFDVSNEYDKTKLLVAQRKREPAKGTLDLPGGFVDHDETVESCMAREIKEELNLTVIEQQFLFSVPNIYPYRQVTYSVIDFVFVCRVDSFSPLMPADDISDCFFIPLSDLDENLFGLASVKQVIQQLKNRKIPFLPMSRA
jgi:NAD+ diphosphatase